MNYLPIGLRLDSTYTLGVVRASIALKSLESFPSITWHWSNTISSCPLALYNSNGNPVLAGKRVVGVKFSHRIAVPAPLSVNLDTGESAAEI